jgi:hyperosmotically inducible periplasmic protein
MTKTGLAIVLGSLAWGCNQPEQPIPLKPKPKAEASAVTPANTAPAPVAPAAKAEEPKPDPNKELAQRVKRALESDKQIPAFGIDVTAADGKVTLWGTTGTAAERSRAAQAAAKVDGVTGVDNQLKVVKGS